MSLEEKVIRRTYDKLTSLTKAALLIDADKTNGPADDNSYVRFELNNFHVGNIEEIAKTPKGDLITEAGGEIISLTHVVSQHNRQEEHVAYKATWTNTEYSSITDRNWKVGDLLGLAPRVYYDVGEYVTYDVTVSYQGKSRSYRALAIFHNLYNASDHPKPFFWDHVVGLGGTLNDVWSEKLPAVGQEGQSKQSPTLRGADSLESTSRLRIVPAKWISSIGVAPRPFFETAVSDSNSSSSNVTYSSDQSPRDTTEHTGANSFHAFDVNWASTCSLTSTTNQSCKVQTNAVSTHDKPP